MKYTRTAIADLIVDRLEQEKERLLSEYRGARTCHFVIDGLLPEGLAYDIFSAFPSVSDMTLKKSLRELKYVTAQMNRCNPLVEETVFAFHDSRVVSLVEEATALRKVEPDRLLYAGGISVMTAGHFLNPHIDNSHDKTRERYRVLNLLYYVTPNWGPPDGGSLELWPDGTKGAPVIIPSLFNRLVVMATNRNSWHSVTPIRSRAPRCCVSNYYFSELSPETEDYFHVTSFRGRPEQPFRDLVLRADISLRMLLRKLRPKGIVENKHFYRKMT